ncbi:MAG: hypothetical protein ACYC3L_13895 [Gemmatimonadaceae bacterium]
MTAPTGGPESASPAPAYASPARLADPRWGLFAVIVALLAIAASATSLRNGFTYDDRWIILDNSRVHGLRALWHYFDESYWPMKSGAGLYRPLIIVAYAVQWTLGGGSPLLFHVVNVMLAAACAVAVFWVAGFLVPIGAAFLAAALFAVHPVHVEAVANVVGQAELWAGIIVLLAFGLYARDRREGALRRETGLAIWFLFSVGLFFKEHVIVLPALLVAAEVLLYEDGTVWRRLDRLRLLLWPMVIGVAAYLAMRMQVIGAVGGDVEHPALHNTTAVERMLIMLNVVPEYGRLLLWPMRLFADYSPRHLMVYGHPDPSQITGVVLLVCAVLTFAISVRIARPVAFAIAWFVLLIGPVTNVLIPTGILLAERTLYLPSVGALIALAYGITLVEARLRAEHSPLRRAVPLLCALVLVLGVVRSSTRNAFWHDSDSAFAQMVDEEPMSFKAHYAWGGQLFEAKKGKEGELEWRLAIALMPEYYGVYMDLAHKYREAHLCQAAIPLYEKALSIEPDLPIGRVAMAACQLELAQWRRARTTSRIAIADGEYRKAFIYIIGRADSSLVATDSLDPTIGAKWLAHRAK